MRTGNIQILTKHGPEDGMWLPTGGQVENGHIRNNILGTGRRKKERKNILMNVKRNFEQFCSKSLCLSKTCSF